MLNLEKPTIITLFKYYYNKLSTCKMHSKDY